MPVGIKNRTDGDVQVAVDAIRAARERHLFPSLTKEGAPAILETSGNPFCHLVLRGGVRPNYDAASIEAALGSLKASGLPQVLMVDCSHDNSQRVAERQLDVAREVRNQIRNGQNGIRALMVESHLVGGQGDLSAPPLTYGQSITDACLSFDDTERLVKDLATG
jgi:3-deoxy-7-phosphoheptulonate synthase